MKGRFRSYTLLLCAVGIVGCQRKVATAPQPPAPVQQPKPVPAPKTRVARKVKPIRPSPAPSPPAPSPPTSSPLGEFVPAEKRAEAVSQYDASVRSAQASLVQAKAKPNLSPDATRTIERAEAFLQQAQVAYAQGNVSEALTHVHRANILLNNISLSQ